MYEGAKNFFISQLNWWMNNDTEKCSARFEVLTVLLWPSVRCDIVLLDEWFPTFCWHHIPLKHPPINTNLTSLKAWIFTASTWTDQSAIASQYWHYVTKKTELDVPTNHFAAVYTACKWQNWCNMQSSCISLETLVYLYKTCSSSNQDTWEGKVNVRLWGFCTVMLGPIVPTGLMTS
jgi:hypothetical protein